MKKTILIFVFALAYFSCKEEVKTPVSDMKEAVKQEETAKDVVVEETTSIKEDEHIESTVKALKAALIAKGFKIRDFIDEKTKDTILMQQYFIAFLKRGPIIGQNEEEAAHLQAQHLEYIDKLYRLGYVDVSGAFEDKSDMHSAMIYNVPNLKMADSLAKADPMVKSGRLIIEIHPWWAAKGFTLR